MPLSPSEKRRLKNENQALLADIRSRMTATTPSNYYVRDFLNEKGHYSTACILAKATFHHDLSSPKDPCMNLIFEIADCSRKIEIALSFEKGRIGNSIKKLRKIAKAATEVADRMEQFNTYNKAWKSTATPEERKKLGDNWNKY